MKKRLRSVTVIPESMYVEREADRQVVRNLEDAGRPGYVLVARQMGKTNLLLHQRGISAATGANFAYLDVSNQFPDLRSFFRNIVDVIAQTVNCFPWTKSSLARNSGANLLPHKEHEQELVSVLSHLSGKLVICLDEVDALAGVDYADQIFSFIRSVYFAGRANNPCMERLTYLLSGVAEPVDLIKNKDVSPFNIGEKILLEDFSYTELLALIEKAGLNVSAVSVDRIFEWASGHPRMSWDICSRLEDYIASGHLVTPPLVDEVVKKLYFSDIDMPPVDQLKRVVQENKEIREAIISVHYGRGASISDALRARLYLTGASKLSATGAILIKNRIFEEALSEEFLRSLNGYTEIEFNAFSAGLLSLDRREYETALGQFLAALKAAEDQEDEAVAAAARFHCGRSLFQLGRYELAAREFETAARAVGLPNSERDLCQFFVGISKYRAQDFGAAIDALGEFIQAREPTAVAHVAHYEAMVDWAAAALALGRKSLYAQARIYCVAVVGARQSLLNSESQTRRPAATLAQAYMVLAGAAHHDGELTAALSELDSAEELAGVDQQARIALLRYDWVPADQRKFWIAKAREQVLATSHFSYDQVDGGITFDTIHLLLSRLERTNDAQVALEVVDHLLSAVPSSDLGRAIDALTELCLVNGTVNVASMLLERALSMAPELAVSAKRTLLATICSLVPNRVSRYAEELLSLIVRAGAAKASELVIVHAIFDAALRARNRPLVDLAVEAITLEPVEGYHMTPLERRSWELMRDYTVAYRAIHFSLQNGVALAKGILDSMIREKEFSIAALRLNYLNNMKGVLAAALQRRGAVVRRVGPKIHPNALVTVSYGGEPISGKYKKFSTDIIMGRCWIVVESNGGMQGDSPRADGNE